MTPLEETLQLALEDFGARSLPAEWNRAAATMIDGIALVRKAGGWREYVRVAYDGAEVSVKKDYGRPAAIIAVEKIYAVNTLDKRFTPDLRSDRQIQQFLAKNGHAEEKIAALLSKEGKDAERAKADRAEARRLVTEAALRIAKKTLAEEKRCRELRNYKPKDDE